MNRTLPIIRFVLAWLLLLALPLQAAPAAHAITAMPGHCVMAPAPQAGEHHGQPDGKHHGKHGACASCCVGAAMAPAVLPRLGLARPGAVPIPFHAPHLPSVLPVLPERPPRHVLA